MTTSKPAKRLKKGKCCEALNRYNIYTALLMSKLPGKAQWHAAQRSTTGHSRQKVRQDGERNTMIREMKEANSFFILQDLLIIIG